MSESPPDWITERVMKLARLAGSNGEVPVAAILCRRNENLQWEIVAESPNRILELKDPTAHAEILVIRDAATKLGSERLPELILVTSLEPCMMCSGATVLSRLQSVYYFAPEQKGPGLAAYLAFAKSHPGRPLNHFPETFHVKELEKETGDLLKAFFRKRRKEPISK